VSVNPDSKYRREISVFAQHPQTNCFCEQLHNTIQQEFYHKEFSKKIYSSLEQLQSDLDVWINPYNTERSHSGKICCGRIPMKTFFLNRSICKEQNAR
jgi:hypothetical protein